MRACCLLFILCCVGCDPALVTQLGQVRTSDLAGSYTGVLQGVRVCSYADVGNPERHVIVDLDLLHQLTIRETGTMTLTMQSDVIPPVRAIVVGKGPVAVNAEFVEFEALDVSNGNVQFDAVTVKQIVFVQHEGEWIVALQLVKVQTEAEEQLNGVHVYQYVSYPAKVGARMSEEETIRYVNTILRLISATQR